MQLKNRQTKSLHNLNSNTNLPRYPFIPYQEGETSKALKQLHQPLVNLTSREAIVIIFVAGFRRFLDDRKLVR